ncbi:hypothetical protein B296_00041917, partial [Ensete ventricosum]
CPSPPSPSLRCRRRCPCVGGGCPLRPTATLPRGGHPLRSTPPPLLEVGLAAVDWPLRAGRWRLPLRTGRRRSCSWVAAPYRGPGHGRSSLVGSHAMAGHPYKGPGRGQPPLHADSMHVATPPSQAAPTFAANRYNQRVEQFYLI